MKFRDILCIYNIISRFFWFGYMRAKPGKITAGAMAAAAAYAMVIYAMSIAPMGMVSSLRETSVIFAALIGTLLFREPFGRQRIIAAILVCLGVVLIKLVSYGVTCVINKRFSARGTEPSADSTGTVKASQCRVWYQRLDQA